MVIPTEYLLEYLLNIQLRRECVQPLLQKIILW